MEYNIEDRVIRTANYIKENGSTIRDVAKALGYSKSTVHNDVHNRLALIDMSLYEEVKKILDYNYSVRHIRGGERTKELYSKNRLKRDKNKL